MTEFREEWEKSKTEMHICPPGQVWIQPYKKRDGTYVRGHCAKKNNQEKCVPPKKRKTIEYGWKNGPFLTIKTEVEEEFNSTNEMGE